MDNDVETDESLSYSEENEENKDLEVEMDKLLEKVVDGWSCKACGKTNKSKSTVKNHLGAHLHGVSHICLLCGKSCQTKTTLTGCSIMKVQNYSLISQARKHLVSCTWWKNLPIHITF